MLNQAIVVGRLTSDGIVKDTESGKKLSTITLAVQRAYKNENGDYDVDFIDCTLWGDIASNTCEYCKKGDLVGVRGRIQTSTYETDDGQKRKVTEIIADKVTFLQSRKSE